MRPACGIQPKDDGRRYQAIIFLISFAVLLYANSLFNNYALDDTLLITKNEFTRRGMHGIRDILTNDSFTGFFGKQENLVAGGRYRPLSHISFAIEYAVAGFSPFFSHLINIIMYALSGAVLYKILIIIFPSSTRGFYFSLPFLATALYLAHPLHTEAVANIKGRDEIISSLAAFSALYYSLRYSNHERLVHVVAASLLFFMGLMSKENILTFIAVIPLTLYFFASARPRTIFFSTFGILAAAITYIVIRAKVLGYYFPVDIKEELLNNPFLGATINQKYATVLLTWGKYLLLTIFPHPLTHDYYPKQIPIIEFGDYRAIIPFLIVMLMIGYALVRFKRKDVISYCILFTGLTFSVSANALFPIGTLMSERFMHLPLLGYCIALAYFVGFIPSFLKSRKAQVAMDVLAGMILLGYSLKTVSRNFAWKDDYTLFSTDVKVSSNSARCNVTYGGLIIESAEKITDLPRRERMLDEALPYLKKGVSIYPEYTAGWLLLGRAMIDRKNYKQARIYYENVLRIVPLHKEALNNWLHCAQASTIAGDYDEAFESYNALIKYQPSNKNLYLGLAEVYGKVNRFDAALAITNKLLFEDPYFGPALIKAGEIYGKYLNDPGKSLEYLLKAFTISPTNVALLLNISVAYSMQKDYLKSIEYLQKAKNIKPEDVQIYFRLADAYLNLGNKEQAAEYRARAAAMGTAGR